MDSPILIAFIYMGKSIIIEGINLHLNQHMRFSYYICTNIPEKRSFKKESTKTALLFGWVCSRELMENFMPLVSFLLYLASLWAAVVYKPLDLYTRSCRFDPGFASLLDET